MHYNIYACPECLGEVRPNLTTLRCIECHKEYNIIENIPIFGDIETYYGEVERSKMVDLLKDSALYGYEKAISQFIKDPFVTKYVLDETRALWAKLLPINLETRFLDVGCGWGTISIPIAKIAGHVSAIDATIERVKFVDLRAQSSNLNNISAALASATNLPFPNQSHDIVAFNGVLEWLGAINTKISPYKIQMQALKEAYRVLKPGGYVYVGIENRYSLKYFLGQADDHSFLCFTSLMPRWMAQAYYKMRTSKDYFMHTHSINTYRKMMKTAGFIRETEYLPWPNYRNPDEFVELKSNEIIHHLNNKLSQESFLSRKWIYLHLLKLLSSVEKKGFFCHSYSLIYKKPIANETIDHT